MSDPPVVDGKLPPGPHGRTREFVQGHQRERLINAMVTAVNANGYAATSVADVIQVARVSRSAFYELFRDKEDCFLACYDRGTTLLFDATQAALAQGGPWRERMRRVYADLTATFAEHPHLARVCMVEALAAGPAANARYRAALDGFVSIIEADMAAHSDVPKVGRLSMFGLVAGSSAIIYEEIVAGRIAQLPDLAEDMTRFFLSGFLGFEAADGERSGPADGRRRPVRQGVPASRRGSLRS
jgi:AcrR family transcriptional regulator